MRPQDSFARRHPAVNFCYFALVLGFSMFLTHPAFLALSLAWAMGYRVGLEGRRALRRGILTLLPLLAVTVLINVLCNHRGETVLAHLPGGAAVTLESLLYAVAAAGMLGAVVTWFGCCQAVMTADKTLFLFGRVAPALTLALTMTLRFVPRFKNRLAAVIQAQRGVGRSVTEGRWRSRFQTAVTVLSILLTWSLDSAVATADSMAGRGYGLPGRTSFSIYRLDRRDKAALLWLALCGGLILWAWATGGLSWRYFPALSPGQVTPRSVLALAAYLALCGTPLILNRREAWLWRRSNCAM